MVTNKFNTTEYLIFNFSVEKSLHISDYISLIYRNEQLNKILTGSIDNSALINMFGKTWGKYRYSTYHNIFGLDNKPEPSNIKISTISIKGDLWYKVN